MTDDGRDAPEDPGLHRGGQFHRAGMYFGTLAFLLAAGAMAFRPEGLTEGFSIFGATVTVYLGGRGAVNWRERGEGFQRAVADREEKKRAAMNGEGA